VKRRRSRRRPPSRPPARRARVQPIRPAEQKALKAELRRRRARRAPLRWNADPEDVHRSVAQLVLALVEFLRKLMERQAIRRMEVGSLTPAEVESVGLGLMRLEEAVRDLARRFDLDPEELNLDLGPLGRLT
jgi:hypothetical protein